MDIKLLINEEAPNSENTTEETAGSSSISTPGQRQEIGAGSSSTQQQQAEETQGPLTLLEKIHASPLVLSTIANTKKKGIYKCSHCSTHFPNFFSLAKHYDDFKVLREFHCPEEACPWHIIGLPTKNELKRHVKAQHQPAQYKCRLGCDNVFHRADARNRHEKQVHLNTNSRLNRTKRRSRWSQSSISSLSSTQGEEHEHEQEQLSEQVRNQHEQQQGHIELEMGQRLGSQIQSIPRTSSTQSNTGDTNKKHQVISRQSGETSSSSSLSSLGSENMNLPEYIHHSEFM
ncbi:hypothetical protein PACTADRAFT_50664 [Pachysolen tannophilus NRRL Y-2460]|uniref:C2H2-type domain-containing protein n=1 Tax=Pachysolen tannophilus NRRL Y-2460 TaxID=669874 RepID=A0A1E4TSS2_PACTA|nr:hypothetical protein PACTADRAFT_50664 [Pachysolen tannophilus NRRL Y-2460]